jgi:hypothetical protein
VRDSWRFIAVIAASAPIRPYGDDREVGRTNVLVKDAGDEGWHGE